MSEFRIEEAYKQVAIYPKSIQISGLSEVSAKSIGKDANSAGMSCSIFVRTKDKATVTIEVEHNFVLLTGSGLSIVLNPDEYPVEDIVICIK